MINFIYYYVLSMRLHFGFITAIAAWAGVEFYQYLMPAANIDIGLKIFLVVTTFLAYGINQIINDYFGLEEDKINAPNRPMVSGKLNPKNALLVSAISMTLVSMITFMIRPISVIPVILGVIFNIIYEYAKAYPVIGNIMFGMSMAVCPVFGFLLVGPVPSSLPWADIIFALCLMVFITGRMTFHTYFKDYQGDLAANKITMIVKLGPNKAARLGVLLALLPTIAVAMYLFWGNQFWKYYLFNFHFVVVYAIAFLLQMWTAWAYLTSPVGDKTYFNLKKSIQACVISLIVFVALFNLFNALLLICLSYILIDFIFELHNDPKG